jgi:hypothetical protein
MALRADYANTKANEYKEMLIYVWHLGTIKISLRRHA